MTAQRNLADAMRGFEIISLIRGIIGFWLLIDYCQQTAALLSNRATTALNQLDDGCFIAIFLF
jgi:hypothetical protein